jgi:hypothetical protein
MPLFSKAISGKLNSRRIQEGHIRNHLVNVNPDSWVYGHLHIGISRADAVFFHQPFH